MAQPLAGTSASVEDILDGPTTSFRLSRTTDATDG
jgi:hypothetical protein